MGGPESGKDNDTMTETTTRRELTVLEDIMSEAQARLDDLQRQLERAIVIASAMKRHGSKDMQEPADNTVDMIRGQIGNARRVQGIMQDRAEELREELGVTQS